MVSRKVRRRDFCFAYPAAALAALPLWGVLAARPTWRPKYILASSLYGTMDLADILGQIRRTGAEHIDIWPIPHGSQREQIDRMGRDAFAALLKQYGVGLGMVSRFDLGPFGLADEMRFVGEMGGRMIVCGSRGPGNLTGDDLTAAIEQFAERMKPHLETAAEHGVTIAIENHANSLVCSPESMYRLMDALTCGPVGIALAPYHLPQEPGLIAEVIRRLGPRMVHFYAWQHGKGCQGGMPKEDELLQLPGRGTLDFGPIVAALCETGYDGWVEVFMHPYPRGAPVLPTRSEITIEVNRSRAYLTCCLPRGARL